MNIAIVFTSAVIALFFQLNETCRAEFHNRVEESNFIFYITQGGCRGEGKRQGSNRNDKCGQPDIPVTETTSLISRIAHIPNHNLMCVCVVCEACMDLCASV